MAEFGRRHSSYTIEQLRELARVPAAEILEWLEEFIDFIEEAMSPETKEIFMKFRRGELVKTDLQR